MNITVLNYPSRSRKESHRRYYVIDNICEEEEEEEVKL